MDVSDRQRALPDSSLAKSGLEEFPMVWDEEEEQYKETSAEKPGQCVSDSGQDTQNLLKAPYHDLMAFDAAA